MIPTFKIRCSAIGKICGGAFNKPTEKQLIKIADLEKKKGEKGLTTLQEVELKELIAKRDNPPELSEGAKTYCQEWLKEQIYDRRKEFSNKYTEKGTVCEPQAIEMVAEHMGYGLISKNEKHYENDFMTGTPDLVLAKIVEDIKNSWSIFTFPLFDTELPNSDYYLQLQGYMELTGINKAAVNYCLIDAPTEIMDAEARRIYYKAGNEGDVPMECYDEVYAKMTYSNVPITLKIKRFEFDYEKSVIAVIKERVELCREYIKSIIPNQVLLNELLSNAA